jgi:Fe-S protein assembly chaperone HscA
MFQIDFGTPEEHIIGIDLGTTNSLAAVMEPDGPRILTGIVPSVVAIADDGSIVAGESARAILLHHPEHAVYSAKRLMGKGLADVQAELEVAPFHIAEGSESVIRLQVGNRILTPPEVGAYVLRELKARAEDALGVAVTKAVITVPAYFNDAQRQATKDAGRIAGLEVLRLVNEPTAAALAYGLEKRKEGIVAVYDLGGGTFDISILKLHDGIFEVLATNGDTHLGGDDIDNRMMQIAIEDIASEWGVDLRQSAEAMELLRRAVISAKEKLSSLMAVDLEYEWAGRRYERTLTRELFENLIRDIIDRTMGPCRQCIRDSGMTVEQIDEVVMVGGSSRIPMVRNAVEVLFRARPHTDLNPDEVVALGAAVQAGILGGSVENQLLLDVTPLSLGIETMGGLVSKIIHRNSTIPASASETFTTSVDGQRNVRIHVVQGERELTKDCRSLLVFDLKDIDPLPAGLARIEVRFLIDANGILNVTARDARTGKEQSMEVKPTYGLTDEQVEAMIEASFNNAEADFAARQVAEARVEADTILLATQKAKTNAAWLQLSDADRAVIARAEAELIESQSTEDHRLIRKKIEALDHATRPLAEGIMNSAVQVALKGTHI